MAKFSDLPYHILNTYFSSLITDATYIGSFSSYIIGTMSGIVADGGYWTKLYIKDSTIGDFIGHKFRIVSISGNLFTFDYGSLTSTHNLATSTITSGSEVYFRKDSYFHNYLTANESSYKNFANTNKHFLYFGKIYSTDVEDRYNIQFYGMKDFVRDALPVNNQTENVVEFLNIYFDKEHQNIYNMTKTLWSLIDPKEVNIDYLAYISQMYGLEINEILSVQSLREWVDNIIYFLKRKGTYSSVYIIWKVLSGDNSNSLYIYDRWHSASVSASPIPDSDFVDYPYTTYYLGDGTAPSGCVAPSGGGYFSQIGSYPPSGTFTMNISGDGTGNILSPHYKVEIDLNCEPFGETYIIDETLVDELYRNWEYTRPVSRFAHYRELLSPLTDMTETDVDVYGNQYNASILSRLTGSVYVSAGTPPASGTYTTNYDHTQDAAADVWLVEHDLDSVDVLTQVYDEDRKLIMPDEQEIINSNNIRLNFGIAVQGNAYTVSLESDGYTRNQVSPSASWDMTHDFDKREILSQYFDEDGDDKRMLPLNVSTNSDGNNMSTTWTSATSGNAIVAKADYIHTQATSAAIWTIGHNLDATGLLVQCYNTDWNQIYPKNIILNTRNTATIEWNSAVPGYACIIFLSQPFDEPTAINIITTWVLGIGTTEEYDPIFNNSVETMVTSGATFTHYEDSNYDYFDFNWLDNTEAEITEVGLLDEYNNLIFYTRCNSVYKKPEFGIQIHYRIRKTEL